MLRWALALLLAASIWALAAFHEYQVAYHREHESSNLASHGFTHDMEDLRMRR